MREIKLPSLNGAHDCTLHCKGAFTDYVDKFLIFFDPLAPYVDIFYCINVDENSTFLDYIKVT